MLTSFEYFESTIMYRILISAKGDSSGRPRNGADGKVRKFEKVDKTWLDEPHGAEIRPVNGKMQVSPQKVHAKGERIAKSAVRSPLSPQLVVKP